MRIRVKFTKEGNVKFVGHLDTVRLFQRAIKAAGIPIAYSQGFNPHALVYFAMPLSVGVSSTGEYMDIVTAEDMSAEEVKARLDKILVRGIDVVDAFEMPTSTESLMSLVDAADYQISLPKAALGEHAVQGIVAVMDQEEIKVIKKTKKSEKEVDIKPLICEFELEESEAEVIIQATIMAGSKQNLSPDLLVQSLVGANYEGLSYSVERQELYHLNEAEELVALDAYKRV
ncbi:MAG: TIGR03936 family radical SAM-associated protein [Cellulosilyticaceae bacterium]